MRTSHWIAACTVAALAGLATPATAGPGKSQAHAAGAHKAAPAAKAAAAKAREAEKSRGHEAAEAKGKEAREAAGEHGKAKGKDEDKDKDKDKGEKEGKDHRGPPEAVQKKLEQLRETRKERRAAHLAKIKHRWGSIVAEPAVRAELKVHAWRMARLDRIRELADAEDKKDVVARVDKLIAKENARHDKHMGVLKSAGGPK